MGITRRFIYLLITGILLLGLAVFYQNSLTIFVLYNLLIITFLFVDYYISPDGSVIDVKRFGGEKLSLYEKEQISFEVHNKGSYKLDISLKDEIPELHFKTDGKAMSGSVLVNEKKKFQYDITPTKRGAFSFGKLHIKYKGRLNLCTRIVKKDLDREYKVYPNMKNLQKYRLSICNNRLFKEGKRNLKLLGNGTSFESLKEYVSGDDYKKMNWKATARINKPIVNQYQPEKNQHVYMFIDTGRPMSYTLKGYRKLDLVVNTALVLSDVINQNGDQSGALLFNTDVNNIVLPGKGAEHRKKIMEALYHIDYTNHTSNYREVFRFFKKKERHRSIVFLFTDFETEEEAENLLQVLPYISRNNMVIIILMRDENMEKIGEKKIENNKDIFEKGMALELLNERKKIIRLLNYKGVFCIECPAEKLEYTAINKYIQVKNQTYF
ncbi:MAG: DUF58 domain-containing protein [Halanaerobiaceae bacterium]